MVAFESLTKRTPPIVDDRLHHVLESRESLERPDHGRAVSARERRDRAGRHHIAQEMPAREMDRAQRHQHVAVRRALPDEAAIHEHVGARRGRRARKGPVVPPAAGELQRCRAVGVHHRPVLGGLVANTRCLAAA